MFSISYLLSLHKTGCTVRRCRRIELSYMVTIMSVEIRHTLHLLYLTSWLLDFLTSWLLDFLTWHLEFLMVSSLMYFHGHALGTVLSLDKMRFSTFSVLSFTSKWTVLCFTSTWTVKIDCISVFEIAFLTERWQNIRCNCVLDKTCVLRLLILKVVPFSNACWKHTKLAFSFFDPRIRGITLIQVKLKLFQVWKLKCNCRYQLYLNCPSPCPMLLHPPPLPRSPRKCIYGLFNSLHLTTTRKEYIRNWGENMLQIFPEMKKVRCQLFSKVSFAQCSTSRLALGSPDWLVVTMPKISLKPL